MSESSLILFVDTVKFNSGDLSSGKVLLNVIKRHYSLDVQHPNTEGQDCSPPPKYPTPIAY